MKVKVFSQNMQLHSLHFQQSEHEGDFFWGILFCVFPKVVLRGPDKDDNYPNFYKAKQLSKMSESCLSLPTVDIPQRNPYLLGIEKRGENAPVGLLGNTVPRWRKCEVKILTAGPLGPLSPFSQAHFGDRGH